MAFIDQLTDISINHTSLSNHWSPMVAIGSYWWPLIDIGTIYINGSVAVNSHCSQLTAIGNDR